MKKIFYILIIIALSFLLFVYTNFGKLEILNQLFPNNESLVQFLIYSIISIIIVGLLIVFIITENNLKKVNKIIKQKTNDLQKQKNKLELVISLFDKNVLATKVNEKNEIIYISEAYTNISGFSEDDIIGKNHNVLRYFNLTKKLKDLNFYDERLSIDLVNIKKDGTKYWVKAVFIPEFDENGDYIGYNTIEEDVSKRKYMEQISITDALTSLYNRRHFDNVFAEKLTSKRKNLLIFCIIDIDFFKQYNDIYGHQAGDITLKRVAKALNSILERSDDMVFRLGGEEFGMLFSVKEQDDALTIAQNARKKIQNLKIEHSGSKVNDFVTISMGLYVIDKTQTSVTDIYHKADQLLYKAKENGRNQVVSNIS
jgi:diguanylate cyclase (GGDEF)-like protein/PAS domain S-box-containing protein